MIASTEAIAHIARELPMSLTDLEATPTFGAAQIRKYGQHFLDCIWAFLQQQRIPLPQHKQRAHEQHSSPPHTQTVDLTMTQGTEGEAANPFRRFEFSPEKGAGQTTGAAAAGGRPPPVAMRWPGVGEGGGVAVGEKRGRGFFETGGEGGRWRTSTPIGS